MDSYNTDRTNALVYNNTIFRSRYDNANQEEDNNMRHNTYTFSNTIVYEIGGPNVIGAPYITYSLSAILCNLSNYTLEWTGEEFP